MKKTPHIHLVSFIISFHERSVYSDDSRRRRVNQPKGLGNFFVFCFYYFMVLFFPLRHSSAPVLFFFSLSCDHGLLTFFYMSQCENNNNNNNNNHIIHAYWCRTPPMCVFEDKVVGGSTGRTLRLCEGSRGTSLTPKICPA